jgi:hypothetical protein
MNTLLKILFLDFDGVLNTDADVSLDRDALRVDLIGLLNTVLTVTGAVVVVSSDWRLHHTVDQLTDMLRAKGFTGTIIGATSRLDFQIIGFDSDGDSIHQKVSRADLILAWLKDNGMLDAKVAIVDDVEPTWDANHPLFNRIVLTDGKMGLSPIDAADLIKLLKD